jgi:Dyp-type peroxidase family
MANLNLEDIQGNLLLGHKRQYVAHLFGEVRADDARQVAYWRKFIDEVHSKVNRASKHEKEKPTVNVAFSYRAVSALRPALAEEIRGRFEAFCEGMPRRADTLGDGKPFQRDAWNKRDVWLSVYADSRAALDEANTELRALGGQPLLAESLSLQGAAIVKERRWHEHFGFRDDISFPAFDGIPGLTQDDIKGRGKLVDGAWQALASGEFVLGQLNESGRDVLSGLSDDARRLLANGSFAVFRHLQQHVQVFRDYVNQFSGRDAEFVAERMMGRKRNGDPLVPVAPGSKGTASEQSDFSYRDDPTGAQCPLGSHVRRTNPRNADGRHRLIRRGMPFGKPLEEGQPETEQLGLLFVAFNADISDQFEFVQKNWCNGTLANNVPQARDPIGSALPARSMMIEGDVTTPRLPRPLLNVPELVTCLGGQYYLYPGLSGLALLGT